MIEAGDIVLTPCKPEVLLENIQEMYCTGCGGGIQIKEESYPTQDMDVITIGCTHNPPCWEVVSFGLFTKEKQDVKKEAQAAEKGTD